MRNEKDNLEECGGVEGEKQNLGSQQDLLMDWLKGDQKEQRCAFGLGIDGRAPRTQAMLK